jgi:hypothetical protein
LENKENFLEKLIDVIGVVSVVALTIHLISNIKKSTETKLISQDGYSAIQDPEKAKRLRKEINDYHKNGQWNSEKIQSIIE